MEALTVFWFFVLGSCIGSFLNVVVYRLPAGLSLNKPKSHCPLCQSPIRAWHNLPIIGWLMLRGQCADCAAPISSRYPLVEAWTGLLFLVLFYAEVVSGGANLPGGPWHTETGVMWVVWSLKWDLLALYLGHCFLLSACVAAGLIAYDGKQVPRSLIVISALVGLAGVTLWPATIPRFAGSGWSTWVGHLDSTWKGDFTWANTRFPWSVSLSASGFLESLSGIALGIQVAFLFSRRLYTNYPPLNNASSALWMLPVLGAFLGWKAVLILANAMLLLSLAVALCKLPPQQVPGLSLLVLPTAFTCVWKQVDSWWWWEVEIGGVRPPIATGFWLLPFLFFSTVGLLVLRLWVNVWVKYSQPETLAELETPIEQEAATITTDTAEDDDEQS